MRSDVSWQARAGQGYIGEPVHGSWGSLVAALGVFLLVYLFVLFMDRYIGRQREHSMLRGFVSGAGGRPAPAPL